MYGINSDTIYPPHSQIVGRRPQIRVGQGMYASTAGLTTQKGEPKTSLHPRYHRRDANQRVCFDVGAAMRIVGRQASNGRSDALRTKATLQQETMTYPGPGALQPLSAVMRQGYRYRSLSAMQCQLVALASQRHSSSPQAQQRDAQHCLLQLVSYKQCYVPQHTYEW